MTLLLPVNMLVKRLYILVVFACWPLFATASVQVYFSNHDSPQKVIIDLINKAQNNIKVAVYSFTSIPISQALLAAQQRGVDVQILADYKANQKYSAVKYLEVHKVPVKRVVKYALMHNKFMIFDNKLVQTGSYNYSKAAEEKNAENIIVTDETNVVKGFLAEWARMAQ